MKRLFLLLSKYLGLFSISEKLYRQRLNILCYHGFSYQDEHKFRPSLFMRTSTLESRLSWLSRNGFTAVSLDAGIRLLKEASLPPRTIVITIDDGFRSTLNLAGPLFARYQFPATVYVTSYYAKKETPIFRLVMQYYAWKLGEENVKSAIFSRLPDRKSDKLMDAIEFAEAEMSEAERITLSKEVAADLGEDYEELTKQGLMSLMNADEIGQISEYGIDVQLHTHRHRLPQSKKDIEGEITENRKFLEGIVGKKLNHFCYPSGIWHPSQIEPLRSLNIETATTCEPGMNRKTSNPLALKRFLDRDDFDQIEFEAELRGYKELMRALRNFVIRRQISTETVENY